MGRRRHGRRRDFGCGKLVAADGISAAGAFWNDACSRFAGESDALRFPFGINAVIELPLVIAGGLLGSAHCVGMCGGFVLTLGSRAASWRINIARQIVFGSGRVFSYVSLGAAAGYGGRRLVSASGFVDAQSWLAVTAGVLLVWQGIAATGLFGRLTSSGRRRRKEVAPPACIRPGLLGNLLRTRGWSASLAAGVLTGLLPCGLVYAFAALAGAAGSLGAGMAVMACFGLGTLPMMTALGLGASLLGVVGRQKMLKAAAWCVVVSGVVSVSRGATNLIARPLEPQAVPQCPFCEAGADAGAANVVRP
jgi:sulfite exporter TauE/SafE